MAAKSASSDLLIYEKTAFSDIFKTVTNSMHIESPDCQITYLNQKNNILYKSMHASDL